MKNWPHCPTPKKIRLEVPGIVGLTLDWWLHLLLEICVKREERGWFLAIPG
jgi:hypothetical protein